MRDLDLWLLGRGLRRRSVSKRLWWWGESVAVSVREFVLGQGKLNLTQRYLRRLISFAGLLTIVIS